MKNNNMENFNRKKVLLVVAGGTGGHIYPSLSLINKMNNYNFVIVTDLRGKGYYEKFFEERSLIKFLLYVSVITTLLLFSIQGTVKAEPMAPPPITKIFFIFFLI